MTNKKRALPDPLVDDVVTEDLLPLSAQLAVVHESQDKLEDGQGLLVVTLLGLGKERCLDWLLPHLPEVRLEVDVGHLGEHVVVNVRGEPLTPPGLRQSPRHLGQVLLRVNWDPVVQFAERV